MKADIHTKSLIVFRDAFREMLESVSGNGHSFEFCKEELKKSKCYRTRLANEFDGNDFPGRHCPRCGLQGLLPILQGARRSHRHHLQVRQMRAAAICRRPVPGTNRVTLTQRDGSDHPCGPLQPHRRGGFKHDRDRFERGGCPRRWDLVDKIPSSYKVRGCPASAIASIG